MEDLEHQIQYFKSKAYYKVLNNQCYINTLQENGVILEETMEAEREDGRNNIYLLEEELAETRNKLLMWLHYCII